MNKLNLNAYSLSEMSQMEMEEVQGGYIGLIIAIALVLFCCQNAY